MRRWRVRSRFAAVVLFALGNTGCALWAATDAAVTVASTAVKTTATVAGAAVEGTVDAARWAAGTDDEANKAQKKSEEEASSKASETAE